MWTRAELKGNAKTVLKSSYWYCFLASLIVGVITCAISGLIAKLVPYISGLVPFFVTFPFVVGLYYYFMRNRAGNGVPNISEIFYSFKNNRYPKVIGTMAWVFLFTFLWFLIPVAGIVFIVIKGIAYSMTAYILTDNTNIGYRRALKLSIAMTNGYKGKIFVLGLSFIGWGILATIPVGLGWLFLAPYINATYSELYAKLRENALNKGICTYEELNLTAQAPVAPEKTVETGNAQ